MDQNERNTISNKAHSLKEIETQKGKSLRTIETHKSIKSKKSTKKLKSDSIIQNLVRGTSKKSTSPNQQNLRTGSRHHSGFTLGQKSEKSNREGQKPPASSNSVNKKGNVFAELEEADNPIRINSTERISKKSMKP